MDIAKAFEACEALQLMTTLTDICLILWSGCYNEKMDEYRAHRLINEEAAKTIDSFLKITERPEIGKLLYHC